MFGDLLPLEGCVVVFNLLVQIQGAVPLPCRGYAVNRPVADGLWMAMYCTAVACMLVSVHQ